MEFPAPSSPTSEIFPRPGRHLACISSAAYVYMYVFMTMLEVLLIAACRVKARSLHWQAWNLQSLDPREVSGGISPKVLSSSSVSQYPGGTKEEP